MNCESCKGTGEIQVGSAAAGQPMTYRYIRCSGCRGTGFEQDRYADAWLTQTVNEFEAEQTIFRGTYLEAKILLTVPYDVRRALTAEAWTMGNYTGGRGSDCLQAAVDKWRRDGTFPYGDRAARAREEERAVNEAIRAKNPGAPWVTLSMN